MECLQRGFTTGSIITVDKEDALRLGEPWTRRYVYNQKSCGECGSRIQSWSDANKRTIYACTTCQLLNVGAETALSEARKDAMAMAQGAKLFHSHCAPDSGLSLPIEKMTVAQLKAELAGRGIQLPKQSNKAGILALLQSKTSEPGTAHLKMASAAEASVAEKKLAAENRAVEHVAEEDDESVMMTPQKRGSGEPGAAFTNPRKKRPGARR